MAVGGTAKDYPLQYLTASTVAAIINYPLWKASAIGQSGFIVTSSTFSPSIAPYVHALSPPYKGAVATVLGMAWARAAIFGGSDMGRDALLDAGYPVTVATMLPPLIVSTVVQCINMPLVRATITIQNPSSTLPNVPTALTHLYQTVGVTGLWHGTSAGILKTVPKYITAVGVKDWLEHVLPPADNSLSSYDNDRLVRSATKSVGAGLAGAALTNPLDVIRNEMFKTDQSLLQTVRSLYKETGYGFIGRGLVKNLIAVAFPVAVTIFLTDMLIQNTAKRRNSLTSSVEKQ